MTIVIDNISRSKIRALLDMEGNTEAVLLIGKHPNNPGELELGTALAEGNINISPSGLPVYMNPSANRPGIRRMARVGDRVPLTREP